MIHRLEDDEIGVGIDGGVVNICGYYHKNMKNPSTISTKSFYNDTGITGRKMKMERNLRKLRKTNNYFKQTHEESDAAVTKTINLPLLIQSLQTKGKNFRTLSNFYGNDYNTSMKLRNYINSQKVMERIVKTVLPTKKHVGLFGDAKFNTNFKGRLPGVFGKFERCARKSRRIIIVDEYRSSCLDSKTLTPMYHPVGVVKVNRDGKAYLPRVNGLYQCSVKKTKNTAEYTRTWGRDKNAAINIHDNFLYKMANGKVREEFRRENKLPSVSKPCRYYYKTLKGQARFWRGIRKQKVA